jgi:hypothetical protein
VRGNISTCLNTCTICWFPSVPLWNLVIRTVIVYIAVLMLLRLSGKRQVANLGTSELVALLLISNAVQNAMNGGDNSLTGGLVLAGVLMVNELHPGRADVFLARLGTLHPGSADAADSSWRVAAEQTCGGSC